MAVYQEDFFGGAASLSAPWVQWRTGGTKDLQRDGSGHGKAQLGSGSDNGAVYNNTIGNDQYSQIQINSWAVSAGTNYVYLFVRSTTTGSPDIHDGGSFYFFWTDGSSDTQLLRVNTGAQTTLDTANGTSFVVGDTFKLEVIGTTLKVYKNGTAITWTTSGTTSVTDNSIASGFPGVGLSVSNTNTDLIDNWEGGDVAVASFVPHQTYMVSMLTQ